MSFFCRLHWFLNVAKFVSCTLEVPGAALVLLRHHSQPSCSVGVRNFTSDAPAQGGMI